jgi:hypothetical protein
MAEHDERIKALEEEVKRLSILALTAVHEYPVASGLYVDSDGMAGYGALKAMRLHLKIEPSRGYCAVGTQSHE